MGRGRILATGLLGLWCLLGGAASLRALAGPTGLRVDRPPEAAGAVGVPLAMAREVTIIRRLLPPDTATIPGDWVVVLPSGVEPFLATYVRYQLAYHHYPRHIDVLDARSAGELDRYVGAVVASGTTLDERWRAEERAGGFTRYVRGSR